MPDDGSVTRWLDGLRAGDDEDIGRLWDRYFHQLVRLARARLPVRGRRAVDEEDVALSAFHSFCERAGKGEFPQLSGRDDLWRVLFTITARKVVATVRHQTRQRRGGGRVLGESALLPSGDDGLEGGLARLLGREPTPEAAVDFAEEYERLLARLDNPTLREVALRRLAGHSSEEIAAALGVSARTVDRKLELIRALWSKEVEG